jgi:thiosulfate reductase cytochrome b subunit
MAKSMRKILITLRVIQINKQGRRANPYHPLTYITIVVGLVVALLMFGFVGMWKEVDLSNPFKYRP